MSTEPTELSLEVLLENCADGVFIIDRDRRLTTFSKACEVITGRSRDTVLGMTCECYDVTDCHDEYGRSLSGALCPAKQLFSNDMPNIRQRMQITRFDGQMTWVETTYSAISDNNGVVTHVVGVMRDISAIKAREDELRALARRDLPTPLSPPPEQMVSPPIGRTRGATKETLDETLRRLEKQHILEALYRSHGQRTEAARALGISRSRLYRRMEALQINPRETESNDLDVLMSKKVPSDSLCG